MDRLRKIFIVGNRACAFTIFPITVFFVILGKSIIGVWLGQKYVPQAYPVLIILILAHTLMLMQSASGRILFGMSKHGKLAVVSLIEGVANLGLSILLVRPFGIMGDALGTAIPLLGTYVLFMPWHLCNRLGVRMWTYLRQAYQLPLLLCAPLAMVLLLLQRWIVPHSYRELIPQLLIGGIVYGLGLAWAYFSNRALHAANISTPAAVVQLDPISPAVESYSEDV
jgi:O-antigen/teichoic acid export membrane protein